MRTRLGRRPQPPRALIELTGQRPKPLTNRCLVDHTPIFDDTPTNPTLFRHASLVDVTALIVACFGALPAAIAAAAHPATTANVAPPTNSLRCFIQTPKSRPLSVMPQHAGRCPASSSISETEASADRSRTSLWTTTPVRRAPDPSLPRFCFSGDVHETQRASRGSCAGRPSSRAGTDPAARRRGAVASHRRSFISSGLNIGSAMAR